MDVRPRDFLRTKKGERAKWNIELNSWVNKDKGMEETRLYVLRWLQGTESLVISLRLE